MRPIAPELARFDEGYYRRYYSNAATRVVSRNEARNEVRFVLAFCDHVGLDVRRFADVGAGTGWWAREFARDVLRYLPDSRAQTAIRRLARKCRGVLYLHVVTRDDEVDEEASDMTGYFRATKWYLKQLAAAGFINAGMGLFVSKRFEGFDPFAIEVRRGRN